MILSIYDSTKQTLVGVFNSIPICSRYIFRQEHNISCDKKIRNHWQFKTKLLNNGMSYAIRTATKEQKELLKNKNYIIVNGYEQPSYNDMKSFDNFEKSN